MSLRKTCNTCKFNDHNKCKRMPPQVVIERVATGPYGNDIMEPIPYQPYVSDDDWCGEHIEDEKK